MSFTMLHASNPPPPPPMPFRDEHPVATADRRGARPPRGFASLIAGLPALLAVLLLVLLAAVFALSGVGILVVAVARSWLVLALVVSGLVAPALLLLILAPAVVLITINLRV